MRRDQAESPEGATGAVWPSRVTIALAAIALVAGGVFQASQTQKPWWYVAIAIGYGVGVGLPAFWIAFTKGHPLPRDRDSVTPATVVVGVLCAVVALGAVGWHRAHQRDDARHKAEQAERTGLRRAALREIEAFVSSRPGVWGGPPDYASSVPGISADLLTHMPLRTDASTSGEPPARRSGLRCREPGGRLDILVRAPVEVPTREESGDAVHAVDESRVGTRGAADV